MFAIQLPRNTSGSAAPTNALALPITQFGGKADGSTDNLTALNATRAALRTILGSNTNGQKAYVYLPGAQHPWAFSRPIELDSPYIGLLGDAGSTVLSQGGFGPMVKLGIPDVIPLGGNSTLTLDSSYRPDSYTAGLDGSIVTGTGQRCGIRTKGDATAYFGQTPFSYGRQSVTYGSGVPDHFQEIQDFTVEIAFGKGGLGAWTDTGQAGVFWMGGFGGSNRIACLQHGGSAGLFSFFWTDQAGNQSNLGFNLSQAAGLRRLAIQIRMSNGSAQVFADGVQIAFALNGHGFSGSTHFAKVQRDCMLVGADPNNDNRPLLATSATTWDIEIHGWAFSAAARYQDLGVGQPNTRIDGFPTVNDVYRYSYFGPNPDPNSFAILYGEVPTSFTSRNIGVFCPSAYSVTYGYMIQTQMNILGGQSGNDIRGIHFLRTGNPIGPVVQMGAVLYPKIRDCVFQGGFDGLATLNGVASYTIDVRDSEFDNVNYPIWGAWSKWKLRELLFRNSGRAAVATWASNVDADQLEVAQFNPWCDSAVLVKGGLYGGEHQYDHVFIDAEGGACNVAPLDMEQSGSLQTFLSVDRWYLGSTANSPVIAPILLRGQAGATHKATVRATMLNAAETTGYQYACDVDTDLWSGSVGVYPDNGNGVHRTAGYGSATNVDAVSPTNPGG